MKNLKKFNEKEYSNYIQSVFDKDTVKNTLNVIENNINIFSRLICSNLLKINTKKAYNANSKYYDYYITTSYITVDLYRLISYICFVTKKNNVSFNDLGSGLGILLDNLKLCYYKFYDYKSHENNFRISLNGYEFNKNYVNFSKVFNNYYADIYHKDITKLSIENINKKDINIFYFWEPIIDSKLSKLFINNLIKIIPKNSIIIHNIAGNNINENLKINVDNKKIIKCGNLGCLHIYIK